MFNTEIPLYTVCMFSSLVLNVIVTLSVYKKYAYKKYSFLKLMIYENIGFILGAKAFSYITAGDFSKSFIYSGMSSYGGLIGSFLMIVLFKFIHKLNFKDLVSVIIPSIPLVYSVCKVGCFLVGCCGGFVYDGFGAIIYEYSPYADSNLSYFPVQILESFFFMLIFLYTVYLIKKDKYSYKHIYFLLIMCCGTKFLLDYFRIEHNGLHLSINQIVSLVIILFVSIVFIINKKKMKTRNCF